MKLRNLRALSFLVLVCGVGVANGTYTAFSEEPSSFFRLLSAIGLTWAASSWIQQDAIEKSISLPFDFGLFLWCFWPIVGPWYLFRSRRLNGLWWILAILGNYIGSAYLGYYIGGSFSNR